MGAALQIPSVTQVTLQGKRFQVHRNDNAFVTEPNGTKRDKTTFEHICEYAWSGGGAFRVLQALERVTKAIVDILNRLGSHLKTFFQARAKEFGIAWTMLTLPRLPIVTKDMIKSWRDLRATAIGEVPGTKIRRVWEVVKNTADAAAMYLYGVSLLLGSIAWKYAGDVLDLINNVADAGLSGQDYLLARETAQIAASDKNADPRLHTASIYTQRYNLLKVAKAVCSIFTGVLGLAILAFGAPLIPAIALIIVSLGSTVFAAWNALYKDSLPLKTIDHFKTTHVQMIPSQA